MFPAAFDYRSPASLEEALGLLAEHGDSAKVMAGGQSLIPLLKLRFAQPGLVIDIGRLPGLSGVTRNGSLTIGALTLLAFSGGWVPQSSGTRSSFRGLDVVDAKTAWISGSRGKVLRTTDGGSTWKLDSIPGARVGFRLSRDECVPAGVA